MPDVLRDGVSASVVVVPPACSAHGLLLFLQHRFAHVAPHEWQQRFAQGLVTDAQGQPVQPHAPVHAGMRIHYWRDLPTAAEREPEPEAILHLDAHLLVADKPHGMAVTPSGKHLRQTLLARLRRRPELAHVAEQLAPLHRIDRDTAGLVLFSVNLATRGAYQALFRAQAMHKTYEAIAPFNPELPLPPERRSRIVPAGHFMQMQEVDGPANAHTRIELLDLLGGVGAPPAAEARGDRSAAMLARYALSPSTGKRHQLRVHMNALGLPILHDGIYPTLLPEGAVDSLAPLQLLARRIAFTDPVTGMARMFESRRLLLN